MICETARKHVFCSNGLMLSASSLLTKALIFTVTSQTGSSVPQSIMMFPLHALIQDERALWTFALRGVTKKNCHFCQWFGELERTCAYSIRVPSSQAIRVSTWFEVVHLGGRREREKGKMEGARGERVCVWERERGGEGRREGEKERERKKKMRVHVCGKRMREIVLLSGFSSVWRRDVARLERPRESSPESRRTGLWLGDVESTLRLEGVGWEKRGGRRWTGRGHRASIEVTGDREEARPLPARLAFEVSQQSAQAQLENIQPGMYDFIIMTFFRQI